MVVKGGRENAMVKKLTFPSVGVDSVAEENGANRKDFASSWDYCFGERKRW